MKIICNSHDGNFDIWNFWLSNWSPFILDNNLDVIINNEMIIDEKMIGVQWASNIRGSRKYPIQKWSDQLIDLLEVIDDEFVLLCQDDYNLVSFDLNSVNQGLEELNNENLDCLHFSDHVNIDKNGFLKIGKYFLNSQVAIWNRRSLLSALSRNQNPWCWELSGHKRLISRLRIKRSYLVNINYIAYIKQGKLLKGDFNIPNDVYSDLLSKKGLYARSKFVGKLFTFKYYIQCLANRLN